MGRSTSTSVSNTSYLNTPLSLQDNRNGVALAGNHDTLLGGTGNTSGSSNVGNNNYQNSGTFSTNNNTLDGGAIKRAFDSTDKSISAITDLTAKILNAQSGANVAALDFTTKANNAALAASNPDAVAAQKNTYLMYGGMALIALFILMKGLK